MFPVMNKIQESLTSLLSSEKGNKLLRNASLHLRSLSTNAHTIKSSGRNQFTNRHNSLVPTTKRSKHYLNELSDSALDSNVAQLERQLTHLEHRARPGRMTLEERRASEGMD